MTLVRFSRLLAFVFAIAARAGRVALSEDEALEVEAVTLAEDVLVAETHVETQAEVEAETQAETKSETATVCALQQIGDKNNDVSQHRLLEICGKVYSAFDEKKTASGWCDHEYPAGSMKASKQCCNELLGYLNESPPQAQSFLITCPEFKGLFPGLRNEWDLDMHHPYVLLPARVELKNSDIITTQKSMCLVLHDFTQDTDSGVAQELDGLRREETLLFQPGKTLHDQLYESFGCEAFTAGFDGLMLPEAFPLKPIPATGKSGSAAMKTKDGLFRLKELLKDELRFWRADAVVDASLMSVGAHFVSHWRTHPNTAMAKYYAIVNSRSGTNPKYWVIMLNAFAGVPDLKDDSESAVLFDLKGSNRACKDKQAKGGKPGETCGKQLEAKEQNFDEHFSNMGLSIFECAYHHDAKDGHTVNQACGGYNNLMGPLFKDVDLLMKLKIHDYSFVLRVTTTADNCPGPITEDGITEDGNWHESMQSWQQAPLWRGTGSEFCALGHMRNSRVAQPVRVTAVLLDYLQDSMTRHNRIAASSIVPGSKIPSNLYGIRFKEYMVKCFRPFVIMEKVRSAPMSHYGGDHGEGAPTKELFDSDFESTLCYDTTDQRLIHTSTHIDHNIDQMKLRCRFGKIQGLRLQGPLSFNMDEESLSDEQVD